MAESKVSGREDTLWEEHGKRHVYIERGKELGSMILSITARILLSYNFRIQALYFAGHLCNDRTIVMQSQDHSKNGTL